MRPDSLLRLWRCINHLLVVEFCLSSLQAWFCSNSMIMNPDKSNSILFATTQHAHSLPDQISVNISGVSIPLCNHVKTLGAVLDSRLTLSQHTKAVSKSCFYHIWALKQIRGSLDDATLCTVATALVVVVVIARRLVSLRQLSRLRKSATAAGSSHRSCIVSCVGLLGQLNRCSTECGATPHCGQTSDMPLAMRAL